ncbi:hypothetical protein [Phyllobacterium salinisoli]|uniref:hypothetical protein n=1 Tax=Phyllobacterium salinisoli TaxID=1899321 RepID=UPI00190FBE66|nr:hypothetical protein [Phyllobacterium salinisoli]
MWRYYVVSLQRLLAAVVQENSFVASIMRSAALLRRSIIGRAGQRRFTTNFVTSDD